MTSTSAAASGPSAASTTKPGSPWLQPPAPIRALFAHFPLRTLPPNALPSSASSSSPQPTLYIFAAPSAAPGSPSFNPACLKWQAHLRLRGIAHRTAASSNHASPSGSLPFLQPARARDGDGRAPERPVPAGRPLRSWARKQAKAPEHELTGLAAAREDAYVALVEHRLRAAWLHSLYLTQNFEARAKPLYVDAASSSAAVRASLAAGLRRAARGAVHALVPPTASAPAPADGVLGGLVGALGWLNPWGAAEDEAEAERIYLGAREAVGALEVLLGQDRWFFGADEPGMLDVSLFAYTHLVLDDGAMGGGEWADKRLRDMVEAREKLVLHARRMHERCFGS